MKRMWVDPPSGWKYGFPKVLEETDNYKELLELSGYPSEDIEFALDNSRYWGVEAEKETD